MLALPDRLGRLFKRRLLGALLFAAVAATAVYLITRERAPTKAAPIEARLELVAGEVWVKVGEQEQRAVSGTALEAGAEVRTTAGARALVGLPDGSRLFLRDGSRVIVDPGTVRLEQGEYWLETPPTDRKALTHRAGEVTVSAADAGLSFRRRNTEVVAYVARGMAVVSSKGGRVELNAGERAVVDGAKPPVAAAVAFWDDWTGGMADFAAGRAIPGAGSGVIYGVDTGAGNGSAARKLEVEKQAVRAVVRGGLSETEVDQTFFNPGERDVEGWYWFTVPERATVTSFAVETNGALVEGELIERKEAAEKYSAAKGSGHSPAILEFVDQRTYRARIYPVVAGRSRRVVLRYIELRPLLGGRLEYIYPMGSAEPVRIGEFSLSVDLGDDGRTMKIATLADARVEDGGRRVTMRRSGYTPRASFQLEARVVSERPAVSLSRFSANGDSADYVMVRYSPDFDWSKVKERRGDVVVVVDTSAAGDDASRQLKSATAEAILRALSDTDRFALVSLDVKPTVLHPAQGLAPAADAQISKALEALADHASGGATDLASLFDVSLSRLHGTEQPAVIYVGDGIATSGEMTGEALVERLRRALSTSRARLFTVGIGTEADHALLGELARAGGGTSFAVERTEQTTARALEVAASVKVPTLTDVEIDLGAGLDEPFISSSGRVSQGAELVVLARTHHPIPPRVKVRGRLAGEAFEREYDVKRDDGVIGPFVPKLWAAEHVRRLLGTARGPDAERGRIVSLGLEYGLMTPFTSILALESDEAYAQMGIERRRSPLRGVRLTALDSAAVDRLSRALPKPASAFAFGCGRDDSSAPMPVAEKGVPEHTPQTLSQEQLAEEQQSQRPASPVPDAAEPKAASAVATGAYAVDGPMEPAKRGLRARRYVQKSGKGSSKPARTEPEMKPDGKTAETVDRDESSPASAALATCSDAAERPLAQRVLLWRKRLGAAGGDPEALLARYQTAQHACELGDWLAERTFLFLLQQRVAGESAASYVVRYFSTRPEVQKYVAKLMLRRTVDAAMVRAIERELFGDQIDWVSVDAQLEALPGVEERIAELRKLAAKVPDDPNAGIRLVFAYVDAGRKDEAVALGRRLRDQGFLTPGIARRLGDALAEAGLDAEAVRTYSEIVEFDPTSRGSRQLLGDIYLGHGWYEPAYRQYRTLTEQSPEDALGWLRLAAAAAGNRRVDEALRVERKVASGQGTPGPNDPRRWARLLSAARLAELLADPKRGPEESRSIERKLKELQLWSGPGILSVVTWEELEADLLLVSRIGDDEAGVGELTDAAAVGLSALSMSGPDADRVELALRLRSALRRRPLEARFHRIAWNGKAFDVRVRRVDVPGREGGVTL